MSIVSQPFHQSRMASLLSFLINLTILHLQKQPDLEEVVAMMIARRSFLIQLNKFTIDNLALFYSS